MVGGCASHGIMCSAACGCNPDTCPNHDLTSSRSMASTNLVQVRATFGVDPYARLNITTLLEQALPQFDENARCHFIERVFLPAMNLSAGDAVQVLDSLLSDTSKFQGASDSADFQLAGALVAALRDGELREHFEPLCRGYGVVCTAEGGAEGGTLVEEVAGALYPPFRW